MRVMLQIGLILLYDVYLYKQVRIFFSFVIENFLICNGAFFFSILNFEFHFF